MTESAVFWTAYFRVRPAYSRILQELRQKYRRYGHPAGTVRLEDASEEECRALRNIFGEPFSPPVRFRAERFEAAMRQLKFPEVCLKEVLELYFDEKLVTNRERRQARDSRFCQMLRAAAEEAESAACHQWLQGLEEKQGAGLSCSTGRRNGIWTGRGRHWTGPAGVWRGWSRTPDGRYGLPCSAPRRPGTPMLWTAPRWAGSCSSICWRRGAGRPSRKTRSNGTRCISAAASSATAFPVRSPRRDWSLCLETQSIPPMERCAEVMRSVR